MHRIILLKIQKKVVRWLQLFISFFFFALDQLLEKMKIHWIFGNEKKKQFACIHKNHSVHMYTTYIDSITPTQTHTYLYYRFNVIIQITYRIFILLNCFDPIVIICYNQSCESDFRFCKCQRCKPNEYY